MKNFIAILLMIFGIAGPANALSLDDLRSFSVSDLFSEGIEFVAETQISGPNDDFMSLCYQTREIDFFGFALASNIQGYVLANDLCTGDVIRPFSEAQLISAQSFGQIDPGIPAIAVNSPERLLRSYGIFIIIKLAMIFVILRRLKSLFRFGPNAPMRKKAANKVLSAVCHVAKCDGFVSSEEVEMIAETMERLTNHTYKPAEIIRLSEQVDLNLTPQDYTHFGKGLRDTEKDIMLRSVLYIAMASDRLQPAEYEFATELANGLGMPAEDFRRVLNIALADK